MSKGRDKESELIRYVEQLDEAKVLELAAELLDEGIDPLRLLELVNEGMKRVGKLYESRDYYIADLIMAGIIFRQVLSLDKMVEHFQARHGEKIIGRVLVGTVAGDIHDIGKEIFRGLMEANGFEVIDLGVDVPSETFVKKAAELRPDIVGLSGVLTNTIDAMKEVVDALAEAGLRDSLKVIVGGSHLTAEACSYIGADAFAREASEGVKKCLEWISSEGGEGGCGDD
ncbi:MAG: cobalamin B12-binding domain-containing protein [Thermacetogeniaceae bacterium]